MSGPLEVRVALVAGATRGAGRGIAVELGAAGATVYVTGRSTRARRSAYDRPETIEDTADLVTAAGGSQGLLREPAALAPEPGREQFIGEVSPAAETFGIHPGMRMGEALARCPRLVLIPPDPVGVASTTLLPPSSSISASSWCG